VHLGIRRVHAVLLSATMLGGLVLAGCDDNVEVIRDPDVRIHKGMTWAWRPVSETAPPRKDADGRPVTSRDTIGAPGGPPQHLESNRDWNNEENRTKLQQAIERGLSSKGLTKVTDPAVADFLVDYHVAVKTQSAQVQRVPGGYPGVVCGPYGCWYGYGWGWGPPEVEYRTVRYREGTFVLDMALRNPKKLAYRAVSQKELNHRTISTYQADEAVNHLLKGLKIQ
jgi:hypothetical protein